ncbi:MAG: hypothetical protein KM310_05875 [Clostridiales bacterium]|nr:hypothetical protein [Clostridiales bacterium]
MKRLLAFALLMLLLVAGCQSSLRELPQRLSQKGDLTPWAPEELLSFEKAAEDLTDAALLDDWASAEEYTRRLQVAWPRVKDEMISRQVAEGSILRVERLLEKAEEGVQMKDALDTAAAANGLNLYAGHFLSLYEMSIPAAIPMLDGAVRSIVVAARKGDWEGAEAALGALDGAWIQFHPAAWVKKPKAAGQVDAHLDEMEAAIRAKDQGQVDQVAKKLLQDLQSLRQELTR